QGRGTGLRTVPYADQRRHVPAQHLGRPALGRTGGRGRGGSRAGRGHAPAHLAAAWLAGARCRCLPSFRIRHDQLRSRPVILRRPSCESRLTAPPVRPSRKTPLKRTRLPLRPQGVRSRTAHGLTAAAAEGRFTLQVCLDCNAVIYPPRDACPSCLSARLPFRDVARGGTLIVETTVRT